MKRRQFIFTGAMAAVGMAMPTEAQGAKNNQMRKTPKGSTFTVWQIPSHSNTIGNSYVFQTNTGKVIVETIKMLGISPIDVPGILVKNHGPFAFGTDAIAAVHNAVVLERVAEMAIKTLFLNSNSLMPQYILDKHFARKHGKNAYYGQNK